VDCRDRLAFWLLELALEPVRALSAGEAESVTVRTARGARRFDLMIAREGDDYGWSFREVAASGQPEPAPPFQEEATERLPNPEYAFWAAWEAIEQHAAASAS
jgi:hypothetical protein